MYPVLFCLQKPVPQQSALDLLHKNITTTEIAHQYGFGDNSSFSRTFKKYYGVSPTEF